MNPQNSITYASIRDAGCGAGSALVTSYTTNTNRGNVDSCWLQSVSRGGGATPSVGGESGGGNQTTGGGGGRGVGSSENGSGGGAQQSGGTGVGVGQASP